MLISRAVKVHSAVRAVKYCQSVKGGGWTDQQTPFLTWQAQTEAEKNISSSQAGEKKSQQLYFKLFFMENMSSNIYY